MALDIFSHDMKTHTIALRYAGRRVMIMPNDRRRMQVYDMISTTMRYSLPWKTYKTKDFLQSLT